MTTFSTMLDWFAPEAEEKTLDCFECGVPVPVGKRVTHVLCPDCRRDSIRAVCKRVNRNSGFVKYEFDDPHVNLVYAILQQAERDAAWSKRHESDNSTLDIVECGAREFIEDGGVELWLEALGLSIRPSMRAVIREMVSND